MIIKESKYTRIEWIDAVKGFTIILVVIGHMLRGFTSSGLYTNLEILRYIDYTIYSFHMPLFFMISGMLYSYKTKISNNQEYFYFIKSKAKILLIPYFIFSWLQIIIKIIMSGSVNSKVSFSNLWTIIYNPVEQFWFLYVLFIIFIIVGFMDYKVKNDNINLIIFLLVNCLSRLIPENLWVIANIMDNLIYFYMGRKLILLNNENITNKNIIISIFLYLTVNVLFYNHMDGIEIFNTIKSFLLAILGSLTMIMIFIRVRRNHMICKLGKYSMSIFLLHTIFGSGVRIVLLKLGIDNIVIQVVIGLIAGILVPIYMNKLYINVYRFINSRKLANNFMTNI